MARHRAIKLTFEHERTGRKIVVHATLPSRKAEELVRACLDYRMYFPQIRLGRVVEAIE